jgi:Periplasmic binding protein domain
MRTHLKAVLALLVLWFGVPPSPANAVEDTIKIGVLHSLSGTMAISESVLKDTVLMMIADQNKKGGLLGKKPASCLQRIGWRSCSAAGPRFPESRFFLFSSN